jgi:hypothetical protein
VEFQEQVRHFFTQCLGRHDENSAKILESLERIERKLKTMPTQAELDAAIQTVTDAINKLGADMTKTLADLAAKIAGGQDFTAEIDSLNAAATNLTNFDASAVAADK